MMESQRDKERERKITKRERKQLYRKRRWQADYPWNVSLRNDGEREGYKEKRERETKIKKGRETIDNNNDGNDGLATPGR